MYTPRDVYHIISVNEAYLFGVGIHSQHMQSTSSIPLYIYMLNIFIAIYCCIALFFFTVSLWMDFSVCDVLCSPFTDSIKCTLVYIQKRAASLVVGIFVLL